MKFSQHSTNGFSIKLNLHTKLDSSPLISHKLSSKCAVHGNSLIFQYLNFISQIFCVIKKKFSSEKANFCGVQTAFWRILITLSSLIDYWNELCFNWSTKRPLTHTATLSTDAAHFHKLFESAFRTRLNWSELQGRMIKRMKEGLGQLVRLPARLAHSRRSQPVR